MGLTSCWKKVTENNSFTTYQQQPNKDNFVTITKQNYDPKAWGRKKKTDFIVRKGNHYRSDIKKNFTTKSEAIRFARSLIKKC
jgi:hypothetical protein